MSAAGELRERLVIAVIAAGWDPGTAVAALRELEEFIVGEKAEHPALSEPAAIPARPDLPSPGEDAAPAAKAGDAAPPAPPRKAAQRKTWTPEKVAELKQMWRSSAHISEIAARFNINTGTVAWRASKHGLGPRPRPAVRAATPAPAPDHPSAPPAVAKSAPPPPFPDTSDLPAAAMADGPVAASVNSVITFLRSRDIVVVRDDTVSSDRPHWQVDGHRGCALAADELLDYANKQRAFIGQQPFYYGL